METDSEKPSTPGARSLRYLTVQDALWINLKATKKVHHFRYALLEEAVFYQYGYGTSHDFALQAGRFLSGFMKLHPIDAGNEATAFVGCAAFLLMNGHALDLTDAAARDWIEQVRQGRVRPEESLPIRVVEIHGDGLKVAEAVQEVFDAYPQTIKSLLSASETRAAS